MTAPRTRPARTAFTLIELLVVVSIISVLISLLLPAVQRAREAANRLKCSNNLYQVGLRLHSYDTDWQVFPTAGIAWDSSGTAAFDTVSTFTALLPYVEQNTIYLQFDLSHDYNDSVAPANQKAAQNVLTTLLCPTNPIRSKSGVDSLGYGVTDYMPVAAAFISSTSGSGPLAMTPGASFPTLNDLGALRYSIPRAGRRRAPAGRACRGR